MGRKIVVGLCVFAVVFPSEAGVPSAKQPLLHDCCDLGPPPLASRHGFTARGGDTDFGQQLVLTERKHYQPWHFQASAAYAYTDNAALTEHERIRDSYIRSTAGVLFRPVLSRSLFADIELSYDAYRYDKTGSLDIDEQDARVGVIHVSPRLANTSFFGHYTYDRLLEGRHHGEIYTSHGLQAGFHKGIALGARQSMYARAFSKFSLGDSPGFAQRHEHSLVLAYRIVPTDAIDAELFYRMKFYDFRDGREDLSHLFGVSMSYWFSDRVAITGSISATQNDSNERGGDYELVEGGVSLGMQFTF
jgi:hypothetical protein